MEIRVATHSDLAADGPDGDAHSVGGAHEEVQWWSPGSTTVSGSTESRAAVHGDLSADDLGEAPFVGGAHEEARWWLGCGTMASGGIEFRAAAPEKERDQAKKV
ncbi:hypothetical protein E2562_011912 [Oryza meyeriana var. granulata]|uniref:DUF834 domain-containing protein n=1 Tax=Oryza meyeriana var. granulata TaxID=110450 RepID=A0A6G1CF92_9ORYZ|nr:hypothetical protein E2562_011912 [Oryza meyeriana var. granulata]